MKSTLTYYSIHCIAEDETQEINSWKQVVKKEERARRDEKCSTITYDSHDRQAVDRTRGEELCNRVHTCGRSECSNTMME